MAANNDRLLSDLDDSGSTVLQCDICGIKFHDGQTYEKHMQGKKHQKKVTEAKLMAKDLSAAKKPQNDDANADEDGDDNTEMHCEVCNKYFSGYIPYTGHMKGGLHAKNAKKQKLRQQMEDMPDVLTNEHSGTEDDEIIPKPFAICKICQKEFSGPENYKKHLSSTVHKKKEKQQKTLQTLKADHHPDDAKKSDDDEEFFSKCQVCDKSFSGVVPYQIHMKSNVHNKNVEKKKIAEEMKQFWVEDEDESGYVCKECKKVFSDPSAFKSHLAQNSHEKQKTKAALMDFLKAHPEIVFTTPFEGIDSDEKNDSDDEEDSDYYLICKLCNFSFSGPESAREHVKSKKHLNSKKEKRIQKLLKDQKKKNGEDKSSDKNSRNENGKPLKQKQMADKEESAVDKNGHDFEMI